MRDPLKGVRLRRLPVAPCLGAFLYLLLLLACTIFTQALRSPLSAMVLIFVLLLPIADLTCLVISWFFVSVTVEGTNRVIVRGDRLSVPIRITNDGLLPIACAEATLSIPRPYTLRSKIVAKRVTLPPFSAATTGVSVGFDCRGFFVVGVEEVFLFDFLRLIRIRKRVGRHIQIRVLPMRLPSTGCLPPFDNNGTVRHDTLERNTMNEYGDIREYRPGDSIKSVHWKLSTKWEELQVRKFTSETDKDLLIFADFAAESDVFSFDEFHSAILGNRIAEESLTAAVDAAKLGAVGKIMWFQADGSPAVHDFSDVKSAENLAFPLSDTEGSTGRFPRDLVVSGGVSALCVLAFLSPAQEDKIRRIAADCTDSPFAVLLLSLEDLVLTDEEREKYKDELESMQRRLTESGIPVTVSFRKEASS